MIQTKILRAVVTSAGIMRAPERLARVKSFRAKGPSDHQRGVRGLSSADEQDERSPHRGASIRRTTSCAKRDECSDWNANGHTNGTNGYANGHINGKGHSNGTNGVNGTYSKLTDGKCVRTVYGAIPLSLAMDWPVVASYDELAGCAQWMGGRIPTLEEVRSIYSYIDSDEDGADAEVAWERNSGRQWVS